MKVSNKLIDRFPKSKSGVKKSICPLNKVLKFNTSSFLIKSEEVIREFKEKTIISNKINNIKFQLRTLLSINLDAKDKTDESLLDDFINKIEIPIEKKKKNNFFTENLGKIKKVEVKQLKKKKIRSRLIFFKKISFLLTSIFTGKLVDLEKEKLNNNELEILIKILKKKYWKYGQIKLLDKTLGNLDYKQSQNDLSRFLKILPNNYSLKRVEEVNKFVYKNIIKLMKKRVMIEKNINEKCFYDFYFLNLSKKKNISIKNFYDPLNHKQKMLSLNNKFLILIFSSNKFYDDFFKILEEDFKETYKINVFKKFEKLFKKFEIYYKTKNEKFTLCKILSYLKKTKGLKFPWDFRELECAKESFKGRIDLLLLNNKK